MTVTIRPDMQVTTKKVWLDAAGAKALTEKIAKFNDQVKALPKDGHDLTEPVIYLVSAVEECGGYGHEVTIRRYSQRNAVQLVGEIRHHHTLEANTVKMSPMYECVPNSLDSLKPVCDHCQKTRKRNTTYMVELPDHRVLQVGAGCLDEYLGKFRTQLLKAEAALVADIGKVHAATSKRLSIDKVSKIGLATAAAILAVRNKYPGQPGHDPRFSFNQALATVESDPTVLTDELYQDVVACLADRRAATNSASAIVFYDVVPHNRFRELVSAVKTWTYAQAMAQRAQVSSHVGQPGSRLDLTLALVAAPKALNGLFGTSYLLRFADEAGNEFTSFASCAPEVKVGEPVKVRATVKRHDTYCGVKQTILTRVKF